MSAATLLLAAALPAAAQATEALRVRGLAVGVDAYASYTVPPLRYAVSDATRFRRALVDNGGGAFRDEHLELLADEHATLATVGGRVQALLAEAGPDDVIVLFFSTHGYVVDSRGYLFMHDSELATLERTGLPVADLQRWIDASRARHVLLFTDACHAAAVGTLRAGEGFPADNPFNAVLSSMERSQGSLFNLASSLVQQQSYEGWMYCGGGGAFTCALDEALGGAGDLDGDGLVRLAELSTYVQGRVMDMTRYTQTPEAKGDYDPRLAVAAPGQAPPAPGPAPLAELAVDEPVGGLLVGELLVGELLTEGQLDAEDPQGTGAGAAAPASVAASGLLGVLAADGEDIGGVLGAPAAEASPGGGLWGADPAEEEEQGLSGTYREPWRPWPELAVLGGVVAGGVVPVARTEAGAAPTTAWRAGAAPHAALRLSLHQGALFHPQLLLALAWVDARLEPAGSPAEERTILRLGWELQEQVRLRPWAAVDPYLLASGGAWGGRWVEDAGGVHFRNTPWGAPWLVGGGAGVEWFPLWSSGWTVQVEAAGHAVLGPDAAPGAAVRTSLALTAAL